MANILSSGFKARVVAYSRRAAVRYCEALNGARAALLAEAAALSPAYKAMDDAALLLRPARVRAAVQAWRYRALPAEIAFAVVISSGNNDDPAWAMCSDATEAESRK